MYDLTLGEIKEILKEKVDSEKEKIRHQAFFICKQAHLNATAFNKPEKLPRTLQEAFPEIFEKPKRIPFPSFLKKKVK